MLNLVTSRLPTGEGGDVICVLCFCLAVCDVCVSDIYVCV